MFVVVEACIETCLLILDIRTSCIDTSVVPNNHNALLPTSTGFVTMILT
jgi:hypothetical protein